MHPAVGDPSDTCDERARGWPRRDRSLTQSPYCQCRGLPLVERVFEEEALMPSARVTFSNPTRQGPLASVEVRHG